MSSIAFRTGPGDEQRLANDRHRHWVPPLVLGLLFAIYLLARVAPPGWFAWHARPSIGAPALLLLVGLCFLLSYYLPLGLKKQPVALLTLAGVGWFFGLPALATLLAWHLVAYATFHRPRPGRGPARGPLFDAFFAAAEQAGHALTDDVNGACQEGFGRFDRNVHRGRF